MRGNKSSDRLISQDFQAQRFFLSIRNEQEKVQEILTEKRSSKFVGPIDPTNLKLFQEITSKLIDDHSNVAQRNWSKSKANLEKKVQSVQNRCATDIEFSLRKSIRRCENQFQKWLQKRKTL